MPMENPTLAVLNAEHGPSFVQSPVTPTIFPIFFRVSTRIFLSSGEEWVAEKRSPSSPADSADGKQDLP